MAQHLCTVKNCFVIPGEAFVPKPEVSFGVFLCVFCFGFCVGFYCVLFVCLCGFFVVVVNVSVKQYV